MAGKKRGTAFKLPEARLRELVREATVDSLDEEEQVLGLFTAIEDDLVLPFETKVLGVDVQVVTIEQRRRDEIVAVCKHGRDTQAISIADLVLPDPPPPSLPT